MAARVVYLVVTGQVRPEEVLGLTFTTKAASELRQRIRDALLAAGAIEEVLAAHATAADDEALDALEPTVVTYNAYAANLLSEHGLRIGHEPETRVITDASRYQLGARAVERFTGEVELLSDHPPTVIQNLLALDGAMSEHLVTQRARWRSRTPRRARGFVAALEAERAGKDRKTYCEAVEKAIFAVDRRGELMQLVSRLPSAQGRPRADGLLRPDLPRRAAGRGRSPRWAGWSGRGSGSCCWTSTRTPRSPRRACCRALFSGPDAGHRSRPRGHGRG